MGQALYRKYRSKKLSEIVGQEHVTKTLENSIKSGRLSHAYLFSGPKGVGKTSIARILAHEVNDLPYTDESIHLDIIEIDAASNRRIDEIRDLRDKVHIAPTSAKYKVYIIDEVHMLTKEAFNALLKTLEEPPAHVIFILATTEAHKLPETIVSRTQRFTFKPIDNSKAVEHLRSIAKSEKIDIDDEALQLLAEHSNGSFRDSISMLDQIGLVGSRVTRAKAENLIGVAPKQAIEKLLHSALNQTPANIIEALNELTRLGVNAVQSSKQLAEALRELIIENKALTNRIVANQLLADLLGVASASDPSASLELALFRANASAQPLNSEAIPRRVRTEPSKKESSPPVEPKQKVSRKTSGDLSWWPKVLNEIKQHNNTLYGVLRMGKPSLQGDVLTIDFGFNFHAKKINDAQTATKIQGVIEELTGQNLVLEPRYNNDLQYKNTPEDIQTQSPTATDDILEGTGDENLQAITSIFGGGEVL